MNNSEKTLFDSAKVLGSNEADTYQAKTPKVCGYAGIIIKPARGKFVKYLKDNNIGSRGVYGGYELSASDFIGIRPNLQSIEIKEAAMEKVAEFLNLNGIKCRVRVRML